MLTLYCDNIDYGSKTKKIIFKLFSVSRPYLNHAAIVVRQFWSDLVANLYILWWTGICEFHLVEVYISRLYVSLSVYLPVQRNNFRIISRLSSGIIRVARCTGLINIINRPKNMWWGGGGYIPRFREWRIECNFLKSIWCSGLKDPYNRVAK